VSAVDGRGTLAESKWDYKEPISGYICIRFVFQSVWEDDIIASVNRASS